MSSALFDGLKNGSQEALHTVYLEYRQEFISWVCRTYQLSEDDAKDLYQFATMKLFENAVSGKLTDLTSSLKTYLFAIGRNKALELNRAKGKKLPVAYELYQDDNPEEVLFKEEMLQVVESSLGNLGEPCRTLLNGYYYLRKSMEELAASLQYKNAATAKNQKYKCLQRLKKLCQEQALRINPA